MAFKLPMRTLSGFIQSQSRIFSRHSPPVSTPRQPLQQRLVSYQSPPGRGRPNSQSGYSSHNPSPIPRRIIVIGAGGLCFYLYNQENVPVSGRRRFNCLTEKQTVSLVSGEYVSLVKSLRPRILPAQHPFTQRVAQVVERLLPSSGLPMNEPWRVHVIDAPDEMNAFVIPGGKVFVFSGLVDFAGDDNGLATVLSHEIAHNVCGHTSERLSNSLFGLGAIYLLVALFDVSGQLASGLFEFAYNRPQGKVQEAEADAIGLSMMAQSCFDPQAAVNMWRRMEVAQKYQLPQFLSTHPSHHNRVENLQRLLPEAESKAAESGCKNLGSINESFQDTIHEWL